MSDRRAVTAGRVAAPSVAGEMWRVAVGGNRVESMTVDEIAYAYHNGQLNERTPLWPPGTSGWQALGNFEQFQFAPAQDPMAGHMHGGQGAQGYNAQGQLAQFQESDDDPTRMWTGSADLSELGMPPAPMPSAPMPPVRSAPPPARSAPPPARPSSRTGPRQVSSRAPRPVASAYPSRPTSAAPNRSPSVPPFRARRSSGWLLVAGLVGLVGLGSAVLAARGNWSSAAVEAAAPVAAAPEAAPAAAPENAAAPAAEAPAAAAPEGAAASAEAPAAGVNGVAKYEESGASAFVAGAAPSKDEPSKEAEASGESAEAEPESDATAPTTAAKGKRALRTSTKDATKTQAALKRSVASKSTTSATNAKRAAAPLVSKPKAEPSEDEPAPSSPASPSVNEAAAAALANSAKLASSCRPRGGPSGAGKARIIYSQDGEVQSVEILTAKFRDTLTGSCVRMVFRRAKIEPFKGEPPTFIKSFTIPEE